MVSTICTLAVLEKDTKCKFTFIFPKNEFSMTSFKNCYIMPSMYLCLMKFLAQWTSHCSWIPIYAPRIWGSPGVWIAEKNVCYTLRSARNCCHFAGLEGIFMKENVCILFQISLKVLPKSLNFKKSALVYVMAWCLTCKWLCCQPTRSQVWKFLLTNIHFKMS